MIYWAPLLHFYQPPGQLHQVLERVCNESYRPLIQVFKEHPNAKATVNVNGVLTEFLWQHGFGDVIDGLKELAVRGQIEFVGSGKYHPILPLITEDERRRQIARNHATNRHFFGEAYNPKGFFPPEMCYSHGIIDSIAGTGHKWFIVSGIACPVGWPMDVVHQVESDAGRLAVFFRDDVLSNEISFKEIDGPGFIAHLKELENYKEGDVYVVTAQDAETFGHHIKDWETTFLAEVYEALADEQVMASLTNGSQHIRRALAEQHRALFGYQSEDETKEIEVVTISQLLDIFPLGDVVEPKASSWSTTHEDIAAGNPYPLWNSPGNEIHRLQWEHIQISLELLQEAEAVADNSKSKQHARIARSLADVSLHSCQFWWASKRPMWDINMVHRGLLQQEEVILNAYKAITSSGASSYTKREGYYRVLAARDARAKIRDRLFLD